MCIICIIYGTDLTVSCVEQVIKQRNISNDNNWGSVGEFCGYFFYIFILFILFWW